jgi:hypothetical protein
LGQSTNASLPQFICNTGNCTYPPFATLAYQAACTDVSDKIVVNSTKFDGYSESEFLHQFYLGDSEFSVSYYNESAGDPVLMRTEIDSSSYNRTVFRSLRMDIDPNFLYASTVLNDTVEVVAQECIITPVVQSVQASVRQGIYSETVLDTYTEFSSASSNVTISPPWGPDKGIHPGDDNNFGVGFQVLNGLQEDDYPQKILEGVITTWDRGSGMLFDTDQLQNLWYANVSTLDTCPFTSRGKKDKFACAIQAVADAYTQTIRDAVYKINGTASPEGFVQGATLVPRTFISVEWRWIALHVAVWVLTVIGWVGTVFRSKRLGIPFWRSDPTPMVYMYSAAQQQDQSAAGSGSGFGMDMEMGGDDVMMRLVNEDGHMRLVREP